MMTKVVAERLVRMLERDEKLWLIERGKLKWVRVKIGRAIECGACNGVIKEGEFADLLCVDYAFRKICLEVFCQFCSRQLKRKDALVNAIHEIRLNGRETM
jgi:hypothetical protein